MSIFIKKEQGERLAHLVDGGTRVYMQISVGRQLHSQFKRDETWIPAIGNVDKTSISVITTAFIVLGIVSVLIGAGIGLICYVRRTRRVRTRRGSESEVPLAISPLTSRGAIVTAKTYKHFFNVDIF